MQIDPQSFKPRTIYTADDKPDANPWDTSPKTPEEALHTAKVEAAITGMMRALQKHRGSVTLQQVADSKGVRCELEGELPPIDGIRHGLFFFSVSGNLSGRRWGPSLIGGECALVSAGNAHEARRIAREGLNDTIEAAQRYAFNETLHPEIQAANELLVRNSGIAIDSEVRGRR